MNIFFLHPTPAVAASYHCDKHVGKMLIESCQLLAVAHHEHGNGANVSYKATHKNHPSAIWTRTSTMHYAYVCELAKWLDFEFFKRYGKHHKSGQVLRAELLLPPPALTAGGWVNPPLAMPDEYKADDTVSAYKSYYVSKQSKMPMVYYKGQRTQPEFFHA